MVFGDILSYGKGMSVTSADNQKFRITGLKSTGFKLLGIPHIGVRQRARIIFSLLSIDKNDSVLDAGCGIGLYSFEICNKAGKVKGIDIDKEKLRDAKEIAKRAGKNIDFDYGDLTKLRVKNKFDKIICSDVIEHIKDYKKALSSMASSLKNKGELVLTFPLYTDFNKKTYKRFGHIAPGFKEEEIEKILEENKLKIIKKRKYSGVFTKLSFKINNKILKNSVLTALFFYPLYLFSFLDFLSPENELDGLAVLARKLTD